MKMKLFTAMLLGLFALSACNDDNDTTSPTPEKGKGFIPKITASAEQAPLTKAGVIEDNDYTEGENFYWTRFDQTLVVIGEKEKEYYVSEIDKGFPNQATFSSADTVTIQPGTYNNIVGYFPKHAWTLSTKEATIETIQTQTDRTSEHLGSNMLMLAQRKNVEVNDIDTINLHYKHLASVFRFVVTNNSTKDLKLTDISISLKTTSSAEKPVFGIKGSLESDNATSLTIDAATKVSSIGLRLTGGTAQSFEDKGGKSQCEGYMVVLPVAKEAFEEEDTLEVIFRLTDGTNTYTSTKTGVIKSLTFLKEGIEQGKSYYIQQEITDSNLEKD